MTGPDGNLYFLSRNNEALYKIAYSPNPAAVVVNEPLDQLVSLGYPANFSVSASGTPPFQYQWYKGTTLLLNDTNATLNIPNCAFADSGDYRVVVSNAFGSDTSRYAHLSVTANQPPVAVINTPLPGHITAAATSSASRVMPMIRKTAYCPTPPSSGSSSFTTTRTYIQDPMPEAVFAAELFWCRLPARFRPMFFPALSDRTGRGRLGRFGVRRPATQPQ